jgi:ABC-type bacteriocin/lantibiotic exporter with double-glycine peptidase domain
MMKKHRDSRKFSMKPGKTSRQRYETFRQAYKEGRTDDLSVSESQEKSKPAPKAERRQHMRQYVRWLRPYLAPMLVVLVLAGINAGVESMPPLFMRFVVDHVLLAQNLDSITRLGLLHIVGLVFLCVIIGARLLDTLYHSGRHGDQPGRLAPGQTDLSCDS